jgi:MFS family permease
MSAWGNRAFRWLLVGQGLSSFAVNALYLALGIWAKDLTHSNALAGSVFLALGVPTLLAPFGGHLVDRTRRRPVLIVTNVAIGACLLSLLAVHGRQQLWLIYAVAAATGLATDVLSASRGALLKDMLWDAELGPANAILQTLTQGVRVLSPVLGAGLYTVLGGPGLAVADAALFGVAALALAAVRVTESAPEPTTNRLRTELTAGFRHVRAVPLLLQLVLVGALAFGVTGLFETVGFAVIDQGLHRSPSFLGVLDTVQGAGAVLGGLVAARVLRRLGEARTVGVGLGMVGVGAVFMTLPVLPVVLAGMAVLGAGVPLFVVGWSTGLQRYTPRRLQGRVNAAANLAVTVPQTASIGLGAMLIAIVDYRILLLVIFAGMIACCLMLLVRPAAATTGASRQPADRSPSPTVS